MSGEPLHTQALRHYQAGEHGLAERLCWDLLQRDPLHVQAIYLLGVLALDADQRARAILHFHHVTLLQPDHAPFHHALGEAYRTGGKQTEAVPCFRAALRLDPQLAAAHHGLGLSLLDLNEIDQAVASFRRTLTLQPQHLRAHTNLGHALHRRGDLDGAAACFRESIRLKPDYAIPYNNLGAVLQAQGQLDAAADHFRQAVTLQPAYPEAHFNLGSVLKAQGDPVAAAASFREALRLRPDYARAQHGLGQALETLCDYRAALACYRTAVQLQPDQAEAHESLGNLLLLQPDWDGARTAFERTLQLQPDNADAFARLFVTRQMLCDWRSRDADLVRLWDDTARRLAADRPAPLLPFYALMAPWSAEQRLAVARSHSDVLARQAAPLRQRLAFQPRPSRGPTERLRIGYLSGEFRDHAVSHLLQGVFGLHDRRRFEVFAYSFGPDDGSSYRQRIVRDCDHFRDLRESSQTDAARRIYEDDLHVLVDLQGYIGLPRMSLLALRPAPVQAHYLGYPGSCGADFIDYLIGDPIVTPPQRQGDYRERLVLLPHCYLATDDRQPVAADAGGRAEQGLPPGGVVFCAFHNNYKIEPERFGVWMRILAGVPDGVLWLSPTAGRVQENLRREAEARGVAGQRLIFARREEDKAVHLARHRLADLFLDTAVYNGHTTVCDALWAGLPVLTCPGDTFADRVAASLLTSVGLPELIAAGPQEYERLALSLARQPEELQRLRSKLIIQRTTWPLFDTARLTRNLERAYRAMWDRHAAGQPPCPITVSEPTDEN
jgi:predicted O-linked N-acetylglucosamine transferase (SPINDLY family)